MVTGFLRGQPKTARELVDAIERAIATGALRTDDRLPPVRELADSAGLAPNTVAAAYRTLNQRGVVVGRGRAGTFIASRPPIAAPMAHAVPPGVRDVSTGSPDPALLCPLGPALARIDTSVVLYGAAPVDTALQPWAQAWSVPPGLTVPRCGLVGGALDGVERVLLSHCRPGDRVAVEDPAYASVLDLLGALGLVAVPVGLDEDGLRPERLRAALGQGPAALVLTPRAHNPTGAVLGEERADTLRQVLAAHPDLLVVEDDHAGPVAGAPRRSLITEERARWASIASVAKSLGPDLRVAFLAADPVTLDRVEGRQQLGTGWVSHLLQRTVLALLDDPTTAARLEHAAATYTARRRRLIEHLAAGGVTALGRSGLNVWIPVTAEAPALAELTRRGWWARPGQPYRIASGPALRVSVAALEDAALDELGAALVAAAGAGVGLVHGRVG